jgi:hypothetical protein
MRISYALLFACSTFYALPGHSAPASVCPALFEKAEQEQELISNDTAGRGVVGSGRLYFHTAPDEQCKLKNVFVIAGDGLEAYANYGQFTRVIYWNPGTGAGTAGWVLRSRVAETRTDTAALTAQR